MKILICVTLLVAITSALPQYQQQYQQNRDGEQFTNEAIRQAQQSQLIPKGAQIQQVAPAVQLAAYESIPGNQRIDLQQILGDQFPVEVINNLQSQVNNIQ